MVLPLLMRPLPGAEAPWAAAVLQALGLGVAIAALLSLRRSLGIVPACRGVRTDGPYRWVRHPLYAGELLFLLGFAAQHPSPRNMALFAATLALQAVRAGREERLLASADETYGAYMQRVPFRFLPGVI